MRILRAARWLGMSALGVAIIGGVAGCSSTSSTGGGALLSQMSLVGSPQATLNNSLVTVTGQVKNGDSKQHDIYLYALLLSATGNVYGTASGYADNVPAGQTNNYQLTGTIFKTPYSTVKVFIQSVSENNGAPTTGPDN